MARQLRVFFFLAFSAGLLSGLALTNPDAGRLYVVNESGTVTSMVVAGDLRQPKPQFLADRPIPN